MNRILPTPLPGVYHARRKVHDDTRGSFARIADSGWLENLHAQGHIAQVNHSKTTLRGTVRGIHMQRPPHCGWKTVTCLSGRIWDVAVDLRSGSGTFLRWHAVELSAMESLHIPAGCAHAFQVLEGPAEILYLMSESYQPESELRVHPLDTTLDVKWPLPVTDLSDADSKAPSLTGEFAGVST